MQVVNKILFRIIRFFLFQLTPEKAFDITMSLLEFKRCHINGSPVKPCPTKWMGMELVNPVGIAAGMDKNGLYIDTLGALGTGFIEVGSVTLQPQDGNEGGCITRIPGGLYNDLGMPNMGVHNVVAHIQSSKWIERYTGKIGLNIAKNNTTEWADAADEFTRCMDASWYGVDYWTFNISCPNVKAQGGLFTHIDSILAAVSERQAYISEKYDRYIPIAIKISPTWTTGFLMAVLDGVNDHFIDGVIVSNTMASIGGGESGAGITDTAQSQMESARTLLNCAELCASGGIMTRGDAAARFALGAAVVQLHTGLIFNGPTLVDDVIEARNDVQN